MEYYHLPTNQPVSSEVVQAMVGLDPQLACPEVLSSLGIYLIEEHMGDGVLDNPLPSYTVVGEKAIKTNSPEPLPLEELRTKLSLYLKGWFSDETQRLLGNSQLSLSSFVVLRSLPNPHPLPEIENLTAELNLKGLRVVELLAKAEAAENAKEVKQVYQDFLDSRELHGHS